LYVHKRITIIIQHEWFSETATSPEQEMPFAEAETALASMIGDTNAEGITASKIPQLRAP
jgi:hypothetical protein